MNLVSLLFGFTGRINRVQYWLGCVIGGAGGAVLLVLLTALTIPAEGVPKTPAGVAQLVSSMSMAFGLPMLLMGWIGMALQTKRFHDRGRSGLWTLAPMAPAVMIVSGVIGGAASGANFEHVASSIAMWLMLLQLINLFMFVDLGCMPGKREANKYGPPPRGGFSGGGPTSGAAPARRPAVPASTLMSAESALERAIAARNTPAQAPAAANDAAMPAPANAPAAPSLRPAAAGSFGRKAPR